MQNLKLISHYHLCKANVTAVESYRKKESLYILQARRNAQSAAVQKYDLRSNRLFPSLYQPMSSLKVRSWLYIKWINNSSSSCASEGLMLVPPFSRKLTTHADSTYNNLYELNPSNTLNYSTVLMQKCVSLFSLKKKKKPNSKNFIVFRRREDITVLLYQMMLLSKSYLLWNKGV